MSAFRPSRRPGAARTLAALALLATVAVACGSAGVGDGGPLVTRPPESEAPATASPAPSPTPTTPPASAEPSPGPSATPGATATPGRTATPAPTTAPAGTMAVKVYFLSDGHLVAVHRDVARTVATSRAAMTALIAGPTAAEATASPPLKSAVPAGTLILGITVKDGLATIDLSREFESGGGTASMAARLAQVTYTLTQFPSVRDVAFRLDGQPVDAFGGEGVVIDGTADRDTFTSLLPPIFLDGPAWGGSVANPARLTGLSNVFEATFRVAIRDASGRTLVDRMAMATCGSGCWGTFDVTLPFPSSANGTAGQVAVYDRSAKDGSVQDLVVYPVTLGAG